jgi:hypothetical protein
VAKAAAKFGHVRELPYGRYQARWKINGKVYTARDCEDWRARNRSRGLPEDNWDYGGLTFSSPVEAEKYLEWVRDARERH